MEGQMKKGNFSSLADISNGQLLPEHRLLIVLESKLTHIFYIAVLG